MLDRQVPAESKTSSVNIRRATSDDINACAQICFDAFHTINAKHGFPPDIPSADVAQELISLMFSHPNFYCVVAELDGEIVGSNCLDERSVIAGVGPITVRPDKQDRGAGRELMKALIARAAEQKSAGVRLVQAAFHNRSLSLYTALGFDVREPLSVMQGAPLRRAIPGTAVRKAGPQDVDQCDRVCLQVHGHTRRGELLDALGRGSAVMVERNGRVTGYATGIAFFSHAVAESNFDLQALIADAEAFEGPGFLLPTRNAALLRWCLENGLRIQQPLTLMSMGLYNEPTGAYLPSITF